jgi:hypothetical protein
MTAGCYAQARAPGAFRSIGGAPLGAAAQLLQRGRPGRSAAPHHGPGTRSHPMPAPSASYSITMRVQLDADPGRHRAAHQRRRAGRRHGHRRGRGRVPARPHGGGPDRQRPRRRPRRAAHQGGWRLDGVELRTVSDRNLTFLHSPTPRLTRQAWPSEQPPCWGEGGWRELLAAVRPACRTDAQAASVQVGGPTEYYGYQGSPRRWRGSPGSRRCSQTGQSQVRVLSGSPDLPLCEPRAAGHRPHHPPGCPTHQRWPR